MKKSLISLVICLFVLNILAKKNEEQIIIPLSDPVKPGLLTIKHYKGNIHITGYDGDLVVVNASLRFKDQKSNEDGTLLKQIETHKIQLSATENDNNVRIKSNSENHTIDLEIKVPQKFSLNITNRDYGKISVHNVEGEFEIENINSDIVLTNVSGSAVLNNVDGNITASFNDVASDVPMAFTTIDGKLDITFPDNLNATFKLNTELGKVFSEFDMVIEERKTKSEKSKRTGSKRIFLDNWTYGKVNAGGSEFLFKTYDGNIYIRKRN